MDTTAQSIRKLEKAIVSNNEDINILRQKMNQVNVGMRGTVSREVRLID